MNDVSKKLDILMRMHFPKVINEAIEKGKFLSHDDFKCEVCEDFLDGHCPGEGRKGTAVGECMLGKINKTDFEFGGLRNNKRTYQ